MVSKSVVAIVAILIIAIANMLTLGEERITWAALLIISGLGGMSIWRNSSVIKKP